MAFMEAEEERKTHDQVFSYKCPAILKWIYHKLHICMCIEQPKKLLMSQWPITPLAWLNYRITMAVIITHVPTSFIFSWITTNISNTIAFGVTGGYWVIVYDAIFTIPLQAV
uniref:Uncharacterized protein n=1 Tax=Strigamia maritima TaxID=126957 RepID=T1J1E6_STRMM